MPNPTSKLNLVINGTTTQLDIHDANAVDLTNNQTVGGNKEFTGTTTAHDVIPSATDTYNFGSSTAQWNNAYIKSLTINGVACGDILTHNASEFAYDTNVVHKSGNETIKGNKYFNGNYVDVIGYRFRIKNTVEVAGELPTAENPWTGNRWNGFNFVDKNNVRTFEIARGAMSNGWTFLNFGILNNASNTWLEFLKYEGNSSVSYVSSIDFFPMSNDTYELGSSANKWKSFNGINPGALSLPGTSVNVDTTNWVLDGSNVNIFTPASDGWLGIQATDTVYDQMHYVFVGRTGGGSAYYQQNITSPINALWDSKYRGCIFIPVVKNYNYDIRCICSTIVATFYPCQGNV